MEKFLFIIVVLTSSQILQAGCGGCRTNRKHTLSSTSSGLLDKIPSNNQIEGNVLISCGMCNFLTDDNDCSLSIKIGNKVFKVQGVGIDDHGDSHASDGYCNVIKKKYVEGIVRNNLFLPTKMDGAKI